MGSALSAESDHEINLESAKALEQDSQYAAAQRRRAGERLMAEQVASFGANNIEVSGSAQQAILSDKAEAEIEAMNIVYSGKQQSYQLKKKSYQQKNNAYTGLAIQAGMAYMTGGASLFASGAAAATTNATAGKGYYSENSGQGSGSRGLA